MQKRVLLIHTGGTLAMEGETHLEPGHYASALVEQLPEYVGFAKVDSTILFNIDSSDIGPAQWTAIARKIADARPNYDGFIIIHGTDTMPYTASALAFAFEGLDKPVILTGAQRPLGALRNDARRNLADSIELATLPIPEVGICFDGVLLRGCRSGKINTRAYHAFDSPGCEPLAKLGVDITLGKHIRHPMVPFRCASNFNANVIVLHVTPGISSDVLMRLIEKHEERVDAALDGIVLLPFGVGTVPCLECPIAPFVRTAVDSGIDVLVANASTGKIDLPLYENSQVLLDAGAIPGGEMRMEAALVKLMHACATYSDRQERHDYLRWNVAGELE
ncbi:MAG: asparaginase [Proteobacteria bacterium]|jgi:L-asparaginase|nr:asparaginase [Pseudomonadota bacterium]